ncbi:hypothetical protein RYA05_06000 [Pseudomonas syringae pv. actinidiae]|nr:hypothetical protein [Pseudomonas syringae pv. actinidiae]
MNELLGEFIDHPDQTKESPKVDFVERDIRSEIEYPRNQAQRLPAHQLRAHANRETIDERVSIERQGKHIKISSHRRTTLIKSDDSWPSRGNLSITTTQVENLTYVVLSGDVVQSVQDESDRFIFSNPEIAELFKNDLLKAVSSSDFLKSDHLLLENDLIVEKTNVISNKNKKLNDWLSYIGYGLTTCAIFMVGAIAVGYGWRLAQSWF